jgi:hypothetical protein
VGILDVFIYGVLLLVALYWCKAIFGRFHSDVEDLRTSPDMVAKGVIIFFWLLTLLVLAWLGLFFFGLVRALIHVL